MNDQANQIIYSAFRSAFPAKLLDPVLDITPVEFLVLPPEAASIPLPGLYILGNRQPNDRFALYYVGRCKKFSERLPNHPKWEEAKVCGYPLDDPIVFLHYQASPDLRKVYEGLMIWTYRPPLNKSGNPDYVECGAYKTLPE